MKCLRHNTLFTGRSIALALACFFSTALSFSQPLKVIDGGGQNRTEKIQHPSDVTGFYKQLSNKPFWFSNSVYSLALRQQLVYLVENAGIYGLDKSTYHLPFLMSNLFTANTDSTLAAKTERVFTDAAIGLCKDIYEGKIEGDFSYDEISAKYAAPATRFILQGLAASNQPALLRAFVTSLEPQTAEYRLLTDVLKQAQQYNAKDYIKKLSSSLNYLRWINHFHFSKYILVNIPSTTLHYYQHDSVLLTMNVVVGKPSTKTPRFAAYCDQVILYPYWNVPVSIALNELLPKFKRSPALVDGLNMQVVDANGRVINHHRLNWDRYSRDNFPYSFRQSTGCDNSLGVIKFNITDPFSVYLHDTNNKLAFLSGSRYYSHGCIRVEKPFELGNYLLNNKLDTSFLKLCLKSQQPTVLPLAGPIPVLVVYIMVRAQANGTIENYKDKYGLFK